MVASILGKIGPEANAAVPALIEAFRDEDKFVRRIAAEALANIGPDAKAAVPALIETLKDVNEVIRSSAASALEKLNTPEAQKALKEYRKKSK
jgi:HEAT repeat protein